ncbi:MAG TPA: 50S ribosomal protein L9, partial [Verrucomicrobiae bacterium]|nr:50S ribosomal protein L9 [Verrucomicrobiae bacterium]
SNVIGLGAESDHVKVAPGYARNYLFPRGLAIPLSMGNKRRVESLRQRRAEREAHEFNTMSELSKGIGKLTLLIKVKTGEDGKMFGAVTAGTIADELGHQFDIHLDKRKIHLEQPIRTVGDHEIDLRLHQEIAAKLKVHIESTTPPPAPTEAPEGRGREGREGREGAGPRTEKRGRRPERPERGDRPPRAEAAAEKAVDKGAKPEKAADKGARPAKPKSERAEKPEKKSKA